MLVRKSKNCTNLVGEALLLEVHTGGAVEGGTLGSGRQDRCPGRESTLHGGRNRREEEVKKGRENRVQPEERCDGRKGLEEREKEEREDGNGRGRGKAGGDEAKVSKIFPNPPDGQKLLEGHVARSSNTEVHHGSRTARIVIHDKYLTDCIYLTYTLIQCTRFLQLMGCWSILDMN